ncbi:MAG: hypothetical protein KDA86_05895 [Planctomycetaceae bacterium]|nr:hypothetical protein [Planctomycetaceae bacterium]
MPLKRNLFAALLTSLLVGIPTSAMAQKYCPPCPKNCPPKWSCPPGPQDDWKSAPSHDEPAPAPEMSDAPPSPDSPQAPPQDFQPVAPQTAQPSFTPSQTTTAATSPQAAAPNSIGDFFGTGSSTFYFVGSPYIGPDAASSGGTVGRQKFGENVSTIPRDRVFLNYSFFSNVPLSANGVDVNRFTPGFEKTFNNGDFSFEMRMPFASTADSTFNSDGSVDTGQFEWGDLTVFLKALLYNDCNFAMSGGLGFAFPTRDEFIVRDVGGATAIRVDNNSIHALPFLATLWTPTSNFYVQTFAQFDVDLNGNQVDFAGTPDAGRLQDATYMFLDLNMGYWIYQNPCGNVRGIAPTFELHYNQGLSSSDFVGDSAAEGIGGGDQVSLLNGVVGVNMFLHDNINVQAGYGFPISGDQQFDGEARVTLNWLFGPGGPNHCGLH